jgi:hypothetical protein
MIKGVLPTILGKNESTASLQKKHYPRARLHISRPSKTQNQDKMTNAY